MGLLLYKLLMSMQVSMMIPSHDVHLPAEFMSQRGSIAHWRTRSCGTKHGWSNQSSNSQALVCFLDTAQLKSLVVGFTFQDVRGSLWDRGLTYCGAIFGGREDHWRDRSRGRQLGGKHGKQAEAGEGFVRSMCH
jgi:hypothetical protein